MRIHKDKLSDTEIDQKLEPLLRELNYVTGLDYSCYEHQKKWWLKRKLNDGSKISVDYEYRNFDDLFDNINKTLSDARLLYTMIVSPKEMEFISDGV